MSYNRRPMPYIDLFQERPVLRRISIAAAMVAIFGMALLPHAPRPKQARLETISLAEVHPPFTHVAWHPGAEGDVQGVHPDGR